MLRRSSPRITGAMATFGMVPPLLAQCGRERSPPHWTLWGTGCGREPRKLLRGILIGATWLPAIQKDIPWASDPVGVECVRVFARHLSIFRGYCGRPILV